MDIVRVLRLSPAQRMEALRPYIELLEGDTTLWDFAARLPTREAAILAWVAWGIIPDRRQCLTCRRNLLPRVASRGFGFRWVCAERGHPTASPRQGTFFENTHICPLQAARLLYHFLVKHGVLFAAEECRLSRRVAIDWYNFFREVADVVQDHDYQPIGGPDDIVEVDESHLFTRKYHRGRLLVMERRGASQCWVFGAISRSTGDMWIETIHDKRRVTLDGIMAARIRRGTYIMSDEHRSYRGCDARLGMKGHATVNHRYRFVEGMVDIDGVLPRFGGAVPDSPGIRRVPVHINTVERQWRELKKALRTCRSRPRVPLYVGEFLYRRNVLRHLTSRGAKLRRFLEDMRRMYPGQDGYPRRVRRPGECRCDICAPPPPPRRRVRPQ